MPLWAEKLKNFGEIGVGVNWLPEFWVIHKIFGLKFAYLNEYLNDVQQDKHAALTIYVRAKIVRRKRVFFYQNLGQNLEA